MKRIVIISALILCGFVAGWIGAAFRLQHQFEKLMAFEEESRNESIRDVRQRIFGDSYFHQRGISPESDARLDRFNPQQSEGSITLSWEGGLGGSDTQIRIQADGKMVVAHNGIARDVGILDEGRCSAFFKKVITSGLANYSEEVIEMKRALAFPNVLSSVTCASTTGFSIQIPELGISKKIAIYAPETELKNYPDIAEFQAMVAMQEDILSFIPKEALSEG